MSDFHAKINLAEASPGKKAAIANFHPEVTQVMPDNGTHPITKWITADPDSKFDSIETGEVPTIIYIKKPNTIGSISLIAKSSTRKGEYRAHNGKDLKSTNAVFVDKKKLASSVISIMAKQKAEEFGFPFIDKSVKTAWNGDEHGLEDFHPTLPKEFRGTEPMSADIPVLVRIPVAAPVCYGKPTPTGGITDEKLADLQDNHDIMRAWGEAISFLAEENDGKSLHDPFTPAEFQYFLEDDQPDWTTNLAPDIWFRFEAIDPDDRDYQQIDHSRNATGIALMERFIAEDPGRKLAFSSSSANKGPDITQAYTLAAAQLSAASAASTPGLDPTTARMTETAFKILCVHARAGNEDDLFFPDDLNPKLKALIKGKIGASAPILMEREQLLFLRMRNGQSTDKVVTEAIEGRYNKAFWSHLAHGAWRTVHIRAAEDLTIDTAFTTFNLAPFDDDSKARREEYMAIHAEELQDRAEWDTKDRSKSATTPTINLDINSAKTFAGMLANTAMFLQFFVSDEHGGFKDDSNPLFAQLTGDILDQLLHFEGKSWRASLDREQPWVWFRLAVQYANAFALWCSLALNPSAISQAGTDIAPEQNDKPIRRVVTMCQAIADGIADAMDRGDAGSFGSAAPPKMWQQCCPKRWAVVQQQMRADLGIHTSSNPQGGTPPGLGREKKNKTPRDDKDKKPKTTHHLKGILIQPIEDSGFGLPEGVKKPHCKDKKGDDKEVCFRGSCRSNKGCAYGESCKKYHITHWKWQNHIDDVKKAQIRAYVAKCSNLDFFDGIDGEATDDKGAEGKEPAHKKPKHTPKGAEAGIGG